MSKVHYSDAIVHIHDEIHNLASLVFLSTLTKFILMRSAIHGDPLDPPACLGLQSN
jgi:hypothetical protein